MILYASSGGTTRKSFKSRVTNPKLEVSGYVKRKTGRLQSSWTFYNHLAETINTVLKKREIEVILADCRVTELTLHPFLPCFSSLSFSLKEPKCCPTMISDVTFDQSGFEILK